MYFFPLHYRLWYIEWMYEKTTVEKSVKYIYINYHLSIFIGKLFWKQVYFSYPNLHHYHTSRENFWQNSDIIRTNRQQPDYVITLRLMWSIFSNFHF